MRKLNRKGFTLIELLAVIVILAVVMGIAVTSVLTSMNKARGGATFDTAQIVANGFLQKYTESLVDGAPSNVYGYNFSNGGTYTYEILESSADTFSISSKTFSLSNATSATALTGETEKSFVTFNADTGKFTVCMAVPNTSSNFVNAYVSKTGQSTVGTFATKGSSSDITAVQVKVGTMMACSDGAQTW